MSTRYAGRKIVDASDNLRNANPFDPWILTVDWQAARDESCVFRK